MARRKRVSEGWPGSWPDLIVQTDTDTAVEYLQRYYSTHDADKPSYTGSQYERVAALNPDPNALGPADFVAVSMLSVKVPAQAALRLLGPAASAVTDCLSRIPTDLDIVDADPLMLGPDSPAGMLWDLLRSGRDGLGRTTTSKLLAAKRPRLLPIWDSFVKQATGSGTAGYWVGFQSVLAGDDRRVWRWLGELRPLATKMPPSISELRILDVLLWMYVEDLNRQPDVSGADARSAGGQR